MSQEEAWRQYIETRITEQSALDVEAIATQTNTDLSLVEHTLKYPTLWKRFGAIYFNETPQLIEALTHRGDVLSAYGNKKLTFDEQQATGLRDLLAAIEWVIRNRLPAPHPSELMALPRDLLRGADYLGVTDRSIQAYPLEISLQDIRAFARGATNFVFRKHMESYGDDLPRIIHAFVEVFGRFPNDISDEIAQMIRKRFQGAETEDEVMSVELPLLILSYSDGPSNVTRDLQLERIGRIRWEKQQRKRDEEIARILQAANATKT